MSDPTDDKTYEGLTLNDYLRHFVPQVKDQQEQIKEVNEAGFKPFYDKAFPETLPKPEYKNKYEKRQAELTLRKTNKKIEKAEKKGKTQKVTKL